MQQIAEKLEHAHIMVANLQCIPVFFANIINPSRPRKVIGTGFVGEGKGSTLQSVLQNARDNSGARKGNGGTGSGRRTMLHTWLQMHPL
jgi:hypothetical protein